MANVAKNPFKNQLNRKAGVKHAMSYTKKNLTAIALLLTILNFICLYLMTCQLSFLTNLFNNSNTIYSKVIPIEKQFKTNPINIASNNVQNILIEHTKNEAENTSNLQKEMQKVEEDQKELKEKFQTQREVINKNKTNNNWRIQIPKLGLDVHIEEGTSSNTLLKAVGHFNKTSKWNGNVCLAGHNRGYLCNFFKDIKNLKVGDEIIYCTKQGKRIYKVETNKVILETDWRYIKETKDNRITLITCEENRGEYRRCVQAVQVAENLQ